MSYPNQITKSIQKFQYYSPKTMDEAVSVLSRGNAQILAGGTDLLIMLKKRIISPEAVVNVKDIPELSGIRKENEEIKIGPLTTISAIGKSPIIKEKCMALHEATRKFATVQIKNMATIGGNICRSSPSADMVPPLMVFGAFLKAVGAKGEREILLKDFFTGPGTNVLDREILKEIVIPYNGKTYGSAFEKVMRNSGDLAKINCAVRIEITDGICEDLKITLGAVGPRPMRAKTVEQALIGKEVAEDAIETAVQMLAEDIAPITDVRSTKEYRSEASKVIVKRLIKKAIERSGK